MAKQKVRPGSLPRHSFSQPSVLFPQLSCLHAAFISLVWNLQRLETNGRLREIYVPGVLRIQQVADVIKKHYSPITVCHVIESFFRTIIYLDREKRIFTEANLVSVGGKKLRNSVLRMSFEFHKGKNTPFNVLQVCT